MNIGRGLESKLGRCWKNGSAEAGKIILGRGWENLVLLMLQVLI
jgi:hypothetical protein